MKCILKWHLSKVRNSSAEIDDKSTWMSLLLLLSVEDFALAIDNIESNSNKWWSMMALYMHFNLNEQDRCIYVSLPREFRIPSWLIMILLIIIAAIVDDDNRISLSNSRYRTTHNNTIDFHPICNSLLSMCVCSGHVWVVCDSLNGSMNWVIWIKHKFYKLTKIHWIIQYFAMWSIQVLVRYLHACM